MSIPNALAWAAEQKEFGELDPNGYREGYGALSALFRDYVHTDDYETVVAGAYAVYGWMPTIMKNGVNRAAWATSSEDLSKLRNTKNWIDAEVILRKAPSILTLVNGSIVGTSKFLHFLNPEIFPIWDSKIGRLFGAHRRDLVEKMESYFGYCSTVAAGIDAVYPEAYAQFVGSGVSPVRRLELLLFLYGQSLADEQRLGAKE